jgi:hypothetical protein
VRRRSSAVLLIGSRSEKGGEVVGDIASEKIWPDRRTGGGRGGNLGRFRRNRDQRRLGHRRAKPQAERERQEGGRAALARERLRDRFAERKEAALEPLDEEHEAGDHADQPDDDTGQVRERLLQDDDLEESDHDNDRGEIPNRVEQTPAQRRN